MKKALLLCVLGLLLLADRQTEAGMSSKMSKKKSMTSKSTMSYSSSSKGNNNVFQHQPSPTPAQRPSPYHWFYANMSMMGSKKSMMGSYKGYAGGGAYSSSYSKSSMSMSKKSSMGMSSKGKGSYGKSSKGKGMSSSMSKKSSTSYKGSGKGKGKGKGSIRMMDAKGKGKGKGATYQTHDPTTSPITAAPVEPTMSPSSLLETGAPVAPTPATQAPVAPTLSPTRDAVQDFDRLCNPDDDGDYGVEEGTMEVIDFAYALETVPGTTDAEVEQIIDDLEGEIAASVIRRLVPECEEFGPQRQLQQNHHGTQRRLAEVLVGLSPRPEDTRLTDRECDKDTGDNRCDLVRASLTIWYVVTNDRRRLQDAIIGEVEGAIRGSMQGGDYDGLARDADPDDPFAAVVSIEWIPLSDLDRNRDITAPPVPDDDDDKGLDLLWIIVIAAGGAAVCCLIAAAFFCTRRASVDDEGEQPDKDGSESENVNDRQLGRFQQTGRADSDSGRASL